MKTKQLKKLFRVASALAIAGYGIAATPSWAQDTRDWDGGSPNVNNNNYAQALNWNPDIVPDGNDQAAFGQFLTPKTTVNINANFDVDKVLFRSGANAQSFNLRVSANNTYSILGTSDFGGNGLGVENQSGLTQTFTVAAANSVLNIQGNSTVTNTGDGSATIINNLNGGQVNISGTSDAGDASTTYNNSNSGTLNFTGGTLANTVSATGANINNTNLGSTNFTGGATDAGNATIINTGGSTIFNNGASAGSADITNRANGLTTFNNFSSATLSNIINGGNAGNAGITTFNDNAVADRSTILNRANGQTIFNDDSRSNASNITNRNGGTTDFNDTSSTEDADQSSSTTITNDNNGVTNFNDTSSANSSNITNQDGGTTNFNDDSTGDTATIRNREGGVVDISGTTTGVSIGSLFGQGNVTIGSKALTLGNLNQDDNIGGTITGTAGSSLTKIGTGNLRLNGDATAPQTTVNGGTLTVNATLASDDTTVNTGATIRGTGMVNGNLRNNDGTIDAGDVGNQREDLTAGGDLIITGNDSVFQSRIRGQNSNSVTAFSNITLDGQVRADVSPNGNYLVNNQYLLARAGVGTRTGEFDGVDEANSDIPTFLTLAPGNGNNGEDGLFYTNDAAFLVLRRNSLNDLGNADSENQQSLQDALSGSLGNLNLASNEENFINAFIVGNSDQRDRLSGDANTVYPVASQMVSDRFNARMRAQALRRNLANLRVSSLPSPRMAYTGQHYNTLLAQNMDGNSTVQMSNMRDQDEMIKSNIWALISGARDNTDSDGNGPGFDAHSTEFQIGLDHSISQRTVVGLSLGKSDGNIDINDRSGDGDLDTTSIGAYIRHEAKSLYATGSLSYSRHNIDSRRDTGLGNASADYDARTISLQGEVGKRYGKGKYSIEPNVNLQLSNTRQDSFNESGPGGLNVDGADYNTRRVGLGVRFVSRDANMRIRPNLFLGYQREFGDEKVDLNNQFGGLNAFNVDGSDLGKNIFTARLGADARISDNFSIVGEIGASFRKNQDSRYIYGGVKYGF